jgi:hypothetical protein
MHFEYSRPLYFTPFTDRSKYGQQTHGVIPQVYCMSMSDNLERKLDDKSNHVPLSYVRL